MRVPASSIRFLVTAAAAGIAWSASADEAASHHRLESPNIPKAQAKAQPSAPGQQLHAETGGHEQMQSENLPKGQRKAQKAAATSKLHSETAGHERLESPNLPKAK